MRRKVLVVQPIHAVGMATSAARNVLAAFDGTLNADVVVNKEVLQQTLGTDKAAKRKLQ